MKNPSLVAGKCNFTIDKFTKEDIKNRTFDIQGEAYGLNVDAGTNIDFSDAQKALIQPVIQAVRGINPWTTLLLNQIRNMVNTYASPDYGKTNFVRMELEKVFVAVNVRPNIIEFGASVKELYNDPDFGLAPYSGEKVILVAEWDETQWDPLTATFRAGLVVPPPVKFTVMNVSRSYVVNQTQIASDRRTFAFPPYLYFTTITDMVNFGIDFNPQTEKTRLSYANPANSTGYIAPSGGVWNFFADASVRTPSIYRDSVPLRLDVAL